MHCMVSAQKYITNIDNGRWDRTVATLSVSGHPLNMALHAFDDHLVVANENDMIR